MKNFFKKVSISKVLLALTLVLFLVTRLYRISDIPSTLYWDEASIGYNAYSISKDLKDEWGETLPLHFRAFGEFKLPVYIYSTSLFVKIFGLSIFSIRISAVIFSFISVILVYLLSKKIYKSEAIGVLSAFIFTTMPWFFIFSRTGYEATAGIMFYLLGIYLALKFYEKPKFIILSTLSFILSMYSYNSFRIISPLTILIFLSHGLIFYRRFFSKNYLFFLIGFSIFILSLFPIHKLLKYDDGGSRLRAVSIYDQDMNWIENLSVFSESYFSNFSLNYLFINGDSNPRSQIPGIGQINFFLLPFFIIAAYFLLKGKREFYLYLPVILVLISALPVAITKEYPHALRGVAIAPFLSILAALGMGQFVGWTKKDINYIWLLSPILAGFLFYFFVYLNFYIYQKDAWQYGYYHFFEEYKEEFNKYDFVLISDEEAQPYIFALVNLKYNPEKFRSEVKRNSIDKWGFSTVESFANFKFGQIDSNNLPKGNNLILQKKSEPLKSLNMKETIEGLNGGGFFVYESTN